jgi:hypothetical protein
MTDMLRIDRVKTELEVLPSGDSTPAPHSGAGTSSAELLADPRMRERLRDMVLEVLRDHLRALERRGVV